MICTGRERCILRAKSGSKDSKSEILIRKKRFRPKREKNCLQKKQVISILQLNNLVPDLCNKILNLEKRKGEKVHIYIYIKIPRFQFTSCERKVGSTPRRETMETEREEKDRYKDRRVRHNKADYACRVYSLRPIWRQGRYK